MNPITQGAVVIVPFPHSDLSTPKVRPAIVISNKNLKGDDVLLVGLSSKKGGTQSIRVSENDLSKGKLPLTSYAKTGKITYIHKKLIRQVVAYLRPEKLHEMIASVWSIIKK
ncbi:MAG: type II toxin-antitoxin system PemK/MazF family toxin [bacterium]|nr:type II toxin-antitoxin system PemK/MazF family toxin [bacterium]